MVCRCAYGPPPSAPGILAYGNTDPQTRRVGSRRCAGPRVVSCARVRIFCNSHGRASVQDCALGLGGLEFVVASEVRMTLVVFDPRTGKQTTITVPEPSEAA